MKYYNKHSEVLIIFGISLIYAFVFSGYTLCNQYLLIIYPDIGIYLSSLLFASMLVCTLVAPYVSYYLLSVKWTVIIGTLGTTFWLLSFNINLEYLIIIATIASGFGSGLYRSHQFILIKKLYPENISRNMTISLSVFNLYGVITTPIIFTMLFFDINILTILKCFTIVVFISQLFLIFVENVKPEKGAQLNYLNLLRTKIWFLLPLSQVQAINFTTFFVFIPKNMNERFDSSILLIATLALVYSFVCPVATYLVGFLFNKTLNYRYMYFVVSIFMSVIVSAFLIYTLHFHISESIYDYILICALGVLWAIYDSILYTINMIIMGELFNENIFCIQRIFYTFNVSLCVMLVKMLSTYMFLGLIVVLNVLSLVGYVLLSSVNRQKENYEEIV